MRERRHRKLNKMIVLIAALVMMVLLSGCRTRISNNTEVASTISDEGGWLRELYQERRDELGIPVAKKPFFTGYEEEDEDLDDYDEDLDYTPRDPASSDEDYEDEDDDEDDDSDDDVGSGSQTRRQSSTARRRSGSSSRKTSSSKKKTSGTSGSGTDTGSSEEQTEEEQTKKQYTVSFDGNGVDMAGVTISVDEGGVYGSLPAPPARDDYTFDGWFTEKDGGTQVTEESVYSATEDQTLYAHWTKKDPEEVWSNRFDIAANEQTEKLDCLLRGDVVNAMEKMVEDCKGNLVEMTGSPKCVILFASNENVSDENAKAIFDETVSEDAALEKVLIISDDAINGTDRQKLLYKLVLLDAMHGSFGQDKLDEAASDLGISEYWLATYTKP